MAKAAAASRTRVRAAAKVSEPPVAAALAPGVHPGRIEVRSRDAWRVRLLDGTLVRARPADEVEPGLLDECFRARRTVLVAAGPVGAVILGALQTACAPVREADGTLRVRGRRVEVQADEGIELRVGASAIRLDQRGVIKMVGNRMTLDVAAVVRVLSALVELP
ncbi:hypothetical protein [Chondromyces apiculatus]|uniref:Uncharacterized protein n=1 Tax=Chondromyces apiculatus DSM 436 TaxID=1192034 RepID=A0A017T9S8_9BACT|nr:hypothetical protein [Chondromyces apiculatus]EYF05994.1 Hypothetical protein CAP_2454 [Chondromyces apiculatus DSM 436]